MADKHSKPQTRAQGELRRDGIVRPDAPATKDAKRGRHEKHDLDESGHGAESYTGSAGFDDAQPSGQYGEGDARERVKVPGDG